jgi:hypothetical protein
MPTFGGKRGWLRSWTLNGRNNEISLRDERPSADLQVKYHIEEHWGYYGQGWKEKSGMKEDLVGTVSLATTSLAVLVTITWWIKRRGSVI